MADGRHWFPMESDRQDFYPFSGATPTIGEAGGLAPREPTKGFEGISTRSTFGP